jgi:hypothetical protein
MLDDDDKLETKPEAGLRTGTVETENSTREDPKPNPDNDEPITTTEQSKPEPGQSNPNVFNSADKTREGYGLDYPTNVSSIPSEQSSESDSNTPMPEDNPSTESSSPGVDKRYAMLFY